MAQNFDALSDQWQAIPANQKPELRWTLNRQYYTCQWCGKPLRVGDTTKFIFYDSDDGSNPEIHGTHIRAWICVECGKYADGTDVPLEELVERWQDIEVEWLTRFWYKQEASNFVDLQSRVETLWPEQQLATVTIKLNDNDTPFIVKDVVGFWTHEGDNCVHLRLRDGGRWVSKPGDFILEVVYQ